MHRTTGPRDAATASIPTGTWTAHPRHDVSVAGPKRPTPASTPPATFEGFSSALRQELAPEGLLEPVLVDLIARAAWTLIDGDSEGRSRDSVPAERSLTRALAALDRVRGWHRPRWGHVAPPRAEEPPPCSPSAIPYHVEGLGLPLDPDAPSADDGLWRDRLTLDPDVSDHSPIVKGTWVTVSHVVTLIVDGWTWADILRTHPELCEADIRACLAYAVEEESQ